MECVTIQSMEFDPRDLDMSLSDEELARNIARRGTTWDGAPNAWGVGFLLWYYCGGADEMERMRHAPGKRWPPGEKPCYVLVSLDGMSEGRVEWLKEMSEIKNDSQLISVILREAENDA